MIPTTKHHDRHPGGVELRRARSPTLPVVSRVPMLFLALAATPATAAEPISWGVHAGLWVEDADPLAGVELVVPIAEDWTVVPSLEYVDAGRTDQWMVNGDVAFDLDLDVRASTWVGAGVALIHRSFDHPVHDDDSETDLGLNLLAGASLATDSGLEPYLQAKVVASDDSSAAVVVGLRI